MPNPAVRSPRFGLGSKASLLLLLLFGVALALGAAGLFAVRGLVLRAETERARAGVAVVTDLLERVARENLAGAKMLAARPLVAEALRTRDRAALQTLLAGHFEDLKAVLGTDTLHLHTPETVTVLRLHRPERFGDDLSGTRPMVVAANASRAPRSGIEPGLNGLRVRGAVPVRDAEGRHAGVLELGTTITDAVLEDLADPGIGLAIHLATPEGGMARIAASAEHDPVFTAAELRAGASGKAGVVTTMREADGRRRVATVAPLRDWTGTAIGAIEVAVDSEDLLAGLDQIALGYAGGTAGLLLLALVLGALGRYRVRGVVRDLGLARQALRGMERGEAAPLPGAVAGRGDEIGELARALGSLGAGMDRQKLVLHELNHRIKNILLVVQSMAAQTLRSAGDDPARFCADLTGRLRALAQAHDLLLSRGAGGGPVRLDATVRAALAPWLAAAEPRIDLVGCPEAAVAPEQAKALVLALHELATNAAKHGALSAPAGRVSLRCAPAATAGGGGATLDWAETGGPVLAGRPRRTGFGLRLIERALAADLGEGAVTTWFEPAGLRARIVLRPRAAGAPARDAGARRAGGLARGMLGPPWARLDGPAEPRAVG